jgi:hypothetical protein
LQSGIYRGQHLMHSPVPPMSCRQHHSVELHDTADNGDEVLEPISLRILVQELTEVDTEAVFSPDARTLVAWIPATPSADIITNRISFFIALPLSSRCTKGRSWHRRTDDMSLRPAHCRHVVFGNLPLQV